MLRLHHARRIRFALRAPADAPTSRSKLGPCRTWAAGWLHSDPIGQSELRSRIENRRFLKENGRPDGTRTRIPRLERPGSWLLDDKAEWSADERNRGIAFHETLLDTHKKENTRPASPFNAGLRTACF